MKNTAYYNNQYSKSKSNFHPPHILTCVQAERSSASTHRFFIGVQTSTYVHPYIGKRVLNN